MDAKNEPDCNEIVWKKLGYFFISVAVFVPF